MSLDLITVPSTSTVMGTGPAFANLRRSSSRMRSKVMRGIFWCRKWWGGHSGSAAAGSDSGVNVYKPYGRLLAILTVWLTTAGLDMLSRCMAPSSASTNSRPSRGETPRSSQLRFIALIHLYSPRAVMRYKSSVRLNALRNTAGIPFFFRGTFTAPPGTPSSSTRGRSGAPFFTRTCFERGTLMIDTTSSWKENKRMAFGIKRWLDALSSVRRLLYIVKHPAVRSPRYGFIAKNTMSRCTRAWLHFAGQARTPRHAAPPPLRKASHLGRKSQSVAMFSVCPRAASTLFLHSLVVQWQHR
mmetsp:Transcript_3066/g.5870  ORF Transcript_3066/g.5870 Transcript_3066/m.5870 type:complete len:299 (+) Transcript_3066:219-1115(+)